MRRATFTGTSGVNILFYLCGLIPHEHPLYFRFVDAHSELNARVNFMDQPNAYKMVSFHTALEVCDLLEWLGYYADIEQVTEHHAALIDIFTPIVDKLHRDEYRAAGNLL